jgi:hypothetical protein
MSRGKRSVLGRGEADIERVRTKVYVPPPVEGLLVKIGSSTAITANPYMFLYEWSECQVDANYRPVVKTNGLGGLAISISELGNYGTAYVAHGVANANIPAGFAPVKINVGAMAWIVPSRRDTSSALLWLIVNVQAIDGVCTT